MDAESVFVYPRDGLRDRPCRGRGSRGARVGRRWTGGAGIGVRITRGVPWRQCLDRASVSNYRAGRLCEVAGAVGAARRNADSADSIFSSHKKRL